MKYTPEQLRDMARQTLAARDAGDPRYFELVVCLAFHFMCPFPEVEWRIERLANLSVGPT